ELGHLTLRTLIGKVPPGPSRTMHQSMSVTDYPTALDEGWAEHFEALVVDHSENPWLLGHQRGKYADLIDTWVCEVDGHLRQLGVRRNLFVHDRPLPESALAPCPDPFKVWLEGETLGIFLLDRLKTGQAMLSCEGVIATLFYRVVTNHELRNNWSEPDFYAQFLPPGTPVNDPKDHFSPYENANLKLFAAMRQMARPVDPHRILLLDLVRAFATCFPREVSTMYQILLETTWGATASREVAVALEALANQGQTGHLVAFQEGIDKATKAMRSLHADLLAGRIALDTNVGPELWVLNKSFLVPKSAIRTDLRTIPLAVNLNTASVPELMSIDGIALDLARAIVAKRREVGFFRSINDLNDVEGNTHSLVESLREMQQQMGQANRYDRA
ncbi:MAG TPA: helix-hairpin-helix domain-containing protein, partial [Symbiobacteriaceae bacterium]|nr:helix-hairpin-helix domain-containing protein [Symbiobacteriaceae bacterium]